MTQSDMLSSVRKMQELIRSKTPRKSPYKWRGRPGKISDGEYLHALLAMSLTRTSTDNTPSVVEPVSDRDQVTRNVVLMYRELSKFRRSIKDAT